MSERKKLKILKTILGGYFASGEEYLFYCPVCKHHKKKLSINVVKNVYKCWTCSLLGTSIRRLIRKFGDYNHLSQWTELTDEVDLNLFSGDLFREKEADLPQRIDLPEEFISLANKDLPLTSKNAQLYLKNRGITKKDVTYWKIGYCPSGPYEERIVVPSFDEEGYCNYYVTRTYTKDWRKYMNPPASRDIIFNELYLDFDSDLVLVEGVFDAIVAGPNSVPLLGSTLRETSKLFQEIVKNDTPVYVALDPDASEKEDRLINKLLNYDIEVHKIAIDNGTDVGEMTKEEFKKRKSQAICIEEDMHMLTKAIMAI
tara:strand:+ start:1066 stop:2007 length:942 start_codon:yes stop_codon:yes gene_type:complete